jgi:hypothetical protein
MASPSSVTRSEPRAPTEAPASRTTLVVSCGNPVAADYAARAVGRPATLLAADDGPLDLTAYTGARAAVLFLSPRLTEPDRRAIDQLLDYAVRGSATRIAVVSSFRVHLGDPGPAEAEQYVLARAAALGAHVALFRPGHVLSRSSAVTARLRRLGPFYPLVPRRLHGCCVEGDELFAAIDHELFARRRRGRRVLTLLGPNRAWRDVLAEHRGRGFWSTCLTVLSFALSLLLVGHLAALVLGQLARFRPALRCANVGTLRPGSLRELLALVNPYNYRHVKVVGYNNGVVHFGHRYPGKTVVSTVRCDRVAMAGPDTLKADCGATVRRALDFLHGAGLELPVVPNYSYVCLGTSFFVPIHGSAADFSTVAATITRVVLYDPVRDRLIAAGSDDPAFRDHVYDLRSDVLLLRLYLRVKPKSRYFVDRQTLDNPGAAELLAALRDDRAANVEIRKSRASAAAVTVSRYYTDPDPSSTRLELPRDALGRLWDRLEENPITSFLMHALTRHFAWHVELFFTAEEFARFWESHRSLPLRKLQLRYIRRDGWPHSPFREHDCLSVDLFMLRGHRGRFEAYLHATFAVVRTNPGKHSR